MTKRGKRIVSDSRQMSLLDLLQQERDQRFEEAPGRLNVGARFNAAVKKAIRQAPKSCEIIADEMTHLSGRMVTADMIYNWTAKSHRHRMPPELLPAFCVATGSIEPVRVLAEPAGVFTVPGPDALRAEIQKIDEEAKSLRLEKQKRVLLLKELEGGV